MVGGGARLWGKKNHEIECKGIKWMNKIVGSFLKWKDGNNQGLGCPFKEKNESRSC